MKCYTRLGRHQKAIVEGLYRGEPALGGENAKTLRTLRKCGWTTEDRVLTAEAREYLDCAVAMRVRQLDIQDAREARRTEEYELREVVAKGRLTWCLTHGFMPTVGEREPIAPDKLIHLLEYARDPANDWSDLETKSWSLFRDGRR